MARTYHEDDPGDGARPKVRKMASPSVASRRTGIDLKTLWKQAADGERRGLLEIEVDEDEDVSSKASKFYAMFKRLERLYVLSRTLNLEPTDVAIMQYMIVRYNEKEQVSRPPLDQIARDTRWSERTVQRSLARLRELKLLLATNWPIHPEAEETTRYVFGPQMSLTAKVETQ